MGYYHYRRPSLGHFSAALTTTLEEGEKESQIKRFDDLLETKDLTPKHKEVVLSMKTFFESKGFLTSGQKSFFESIEKTYQKDESWEATFTPKMMEEWKWVLSYYKTTSYFQKQVERQTLNPDRIPTKEEWEKIAQNRYAKKVLKTKEEPALFEKGGWATVRATVNLNTLRRGKLPWGTKLKNEKVLVVGVCEEPMMHKRYKVMLPTAAQYGTFEIEEKYLKKTK